MSKRKKVGMSMTEINVGFAASDSTGHESSTDPVVQGAGAEDSAVVLSDSPVEAVLSREEMLDYMKKVDPSGSYDRLSNEDLKGILAETLQDEGLMQSLSGVVEPPEDTEGPEDDDGEKDGAGKSDAAVLPAPVEAQPIVAGMSPEIKRMVDSLEHRIEELRSKRTSRRVESGSKARPNVRYVLMAKLPAWHSTPQIEQLQRVLYNPEVLREYAPKGTEDEKFLQSVGATPAKAVAIIPEPDLFKLIEDGHKHGVLRTRQPPVRIFQYYRSNLIKDSCLMMR